MSDIQEPVNATSYWISPQDFVKNVEYCGYLFNQKPIDVINGKLVTITIIPGLVYTDLTWKIGDNSTCYVRIYGPNNSDPDSVYLQLCRAVFNSEYATEIQLDHNSPVLYFDKLREEAPDLAARIEALIRAPRYPDVNKFPEGSPVLTRTK